MDRLKTSLKFVFASTVIASLMPQVFVIRAQDLVASDSVTGGASAFVFRESRKKPQAHLAGGHAFLNSSSRRATATRSHSQTADSNC
jgi:hypothetical protein